MNRFLTTTLYAIAAGTAISAAASVGVRNQEIRQSGGELRVDMRIVLDSVSLGANGQLFIIPLVEDGIGNRSVLPAVLAQGRNMHYAWQRGTVERGGQHNYTIYKEVRRRNGQSQTVDYSAGIPCEKWMFGSGVRVVLKTDTCGCGHELGSRVGEAYPVDINPWRSMAVQYITPKVTELPVSIHEGRARVQFEVDRTELHDEPYVCRNGQRIDNRAQLKVIEDSIAYALSDPNVEIARISICGYASPESPYLHNEQLSTGRSRALAEYIARKHNIPAERSSYSSVPENWGEFRTMVEESDRLSDSQRSDLLELIDRPAYGPSDYDAKERELKTSPRFASLYRKMILPEWFPLLRATEFQISTRLKPMSDSELARVIRTTPELMSLNQMMRVARLYEEGSPEFREAITTAIKYYPDDAVANYNGAVAALKDGDFTLARKLLENAGDSPEADNLRGVMAAREGDFDAARSYFSAASSLPEARRNLECLAGL